MGQERLCVHGRVVCQRLEPARVCKGSDTGGPGFLPSFQRRLRVQRSPGSAARHAPPKKEDATAGSEKDFAQNRNCFSDHLVGRGFGGRWIGIDQSHNNSARLHCDQPRLLGSSKARSTAGRILHRVGVRLTNSSGNDWNWYSAFTMALVLWIDDRSISRICETPGRTLRE